MTAGRYSIVCEQGATKSIQMVWRDSEGDPIDLTDYSVRSQVRQTHHSIDPILDLGDEGYISILTPETNGQLSIVIPASVTASLPSGRFVFDIELEDDVGTVTRLIEGSFVVTPEVTR